MARCRTEQALTTMNPSGAEARQVGAGQVFSRTTALLSLPMLALLTAQALAAFADSALLIALIALLKSAADGQRLIAFAQQMFLLPFIFLAPFVGPIADAFSKSRVMLFANLLKLLGVFMIASGMGQWLGFALVGFGAAAYSPAKYGILPELFSEQALVKANAWIEGSTIIMAISGVMLGGYAADYSVSTALGILLACYFLSGLLTLAIPNVAVERPRHSLNPLAMLNSFRLALTKLYGMRAARFSLMGTSLMIAAGTTLRLLIFAWVPVALAIANNQTPALLVGAASIGMILGALLAGRLISVVHAGRALLPGFLLGPCVAALAFSTHLPLAMVIALLIGLCSGTFLVPLNALLQNHGFRTVGAGHAIAVQNFSENLVAVGLVGAYSMIAYLGFPAAQTSLALGAAILAGIALVSMSRPLYAVSTQRSTTL